MSDNVFSRNLSYIFDSPTPLLVGNLTFNLTAAADIASSVWSCANGTGKYVDHRIGDLYIYLVYDVHHKSKNARGMQISTNTSKYKQAY